MKGSVFLYWIMLLVGTGIGYCFGLSGGSTDETKPAEKPKAAKKAPADVGESASVKALRARISQLERQLAEANAARQTEAATNAVAVAAPQGAFGPMRGGNPREWMENMKKNDPERYTQMTNRFAQFRRQRAARQQRNLDFLASVDTSTMSSSAKKTHAALQTALVRRAELEDRIHQEGLSDEDRMTIMEQFRESEHELRRLRSQERRNLIEATANTLGFEGDDAKEIVATIQEVIDATDNGFGRHMGPPRGGPPPGGAPGGGGGRR